MLKRILIGAGLIFLVIQPVSASNTFLLWSPGAEGTPEQAAPLLESWIEYLHSKGLDDASLKAVYQNISVAEGPRQLKKLKPVAGIISLEAYLSLSGQDPLTLLLQTRKLPSGNGESHYILLKNKQATDVESIQLAEPLAPDFVTKVLLSQAPVAYRTLPQHYTDQVLYKLKQVGQGKIRAAVLITDYQEAVLKQLKSPWVKNLEVIARSPSLPAPPLVVFNQWKGSFPAQQFERILLEMDQDPEGKEILQELRLQGFMKPDVAAYEKWQEVLSSPPAQPQ